MELASCDPSGTKNFEVAARFFFFSNLHTSDLEHVLFTRRPSKFPWRWIPTPYLATIFSHAMTSAVSKIRSGYQFQEGFPYKYSKHQRNLCYFIVWNAQKDHCCPAYSVSRHSIPLVTTFKRNGDATWTDFTDQNEGGNSGRQENQQCSSKSKLLLFVKNLKGPL
jgi:hypothetical protein